jgi:hypothetical protein
MAQEKRHQGKLVLRQSCARNPESTDAQEGRVGNKGSKRRMAAISKEEEDNRERHRRVELTTASTSGKRRNTPQDPI